MSYRQLTPEEEKLEESVWALWEAFMMQMQDASEFVNTQTPVMTRQLEDTYQVGERVFQVGSVSGRGSVSGGMGIAIL